jgi:hypothetical protein
MTTSPVLDAGSVHKLYVVPEIFVPLMLAVSVALSTGALLVFPYWITKFTPSPAI